MKTNKQTNKQTNTIRMEWSHWQRLAHSWGRIVIHSFLQKTRSGQLTVPRAFVVWSHHCQQPRFHRVLLGSSELKQLCNCYRLIVKAKMPLTLAVYSSKFHRWKSKGKALEHLVCTSRIFIDLHGSFDVWTFSLRTRPRIEMPSPAKPHSSRSKGSCGHAASNAAELLRHSRKLRLWWKESLMLTQISISAGKKTNRQYLLSSSNAMMVYYI